MQLHRHEALKPIGHGRRFDAQHVRGQRRNHFVSGFEGGLQLPEQHRAIEFEVKIVAAVECIEIAGTFACEIFAVGDNCLAVAVDGILVEAAKHVDMSCHVYQMTRIRNEAAYGIRCPEGFLWSGRHFHEMDIHVEQTRMLHAARLGHGRLENGR